MSRTRFSLRPLLIVGCSLLAAASALCPATAGAVEPSIGGISPYGVQQGTEVEMTLSGGNLSDAKEILFYSPGFTVKSLTPEKDNAVKALIAVAPDCRLGIHAIRLRSERGVSNLRTFTVGNLPEVKEVEPNTDFATPQVIPLNVTVSGVIQAEDVDHFIVELKKGQRLTAELEGLRLGSTFFDPYLAVLDANRFEIARSDDAALLSQDCLCSIVAPEDGKYVIQVRETTFGGSGASTYRMHVGGFPRPTAVYPGGGKPGETLSVRWIGSASGDFTSQVTLPKDATENETGLVAQDSGGIAPSPNMVRVIDLTNALETEPNDEVASATAASAAPLALNGIIEKPGDIDHFKFTAKKGQQFDARVYARKPLRSPLDAVMQIMNEKGGNIANNDDSGGPDSYARFTVPADGNYLVSVRDQLKSGGADFVYRVEITEAKPSLTMSLPERRQYISTTLTVPKANRMALMVRSQRQGFAGELKLAVEGLPAGMTYDTVPATDALAETPILFTAAADASPGGALADLVGKPVDEKIPVVGHLRQRTMLIRGQNNADVWGHDADRMAVVLSKEVPFKIDIVQPKAPLVRSGSLPLKVVATRAADFKEAINLQMLYNPPGTAASASITIPADQNEAVIPITANATAPLATWKVVALGRAANGDECASQFADLTVADQFYKFAFQKTAVEVGSETDVAVKVEKLKDFDGKAKCELVGLPANATAEPIEFDKNATELIFKVKVSKEARPGKSTLLCVSKFEYQGETVTHTLGSGELRVDAPLPPKVAPAKPATPAAANATPVAAAPAKRLSRLEQLRQEKEQQEKKK